MKTRDLAFPFIIIPLGIAFVVVGILLYFYRDSLKLTAAKMRIGAFMLSFSFFVSCGLNQPTCYEQIPINTTSLDDLDSLHSGDTLKGHFYYPTFPFYSMTIEDSANKVIVQRGPLTPVNDSITRGQGDFYIPLDSTLNQGPYRIKIYGEQSKNFKFDSLVDQRNLRIINKPMIP